MKAFVVLAIIGAVAAAPADGKNKLLRAKKSAYGAPCAGAPLSPVTLYLSPGPQGGSYGGGQHYRADEHKEENMEHARSYYESSGVATGVGASTGGAIGSAGASSVGGGAIGVFPSAKVGGCAVPLLLSCSPSVVSGHIAHSASYGGSGYGAGAGAYRAPEEHHKEMKSEHGGGEKAWAVAERAGADLHEMHDEHVPLEQKPLTENFPDHQHEHQKF